MTNTSGDSENMNDSFAAPPTKDQAREIELLIADLGASGITTRQNARKALAALGDPALPVMVDRLVNAEFLVRWEIAKALIEMHHPDSVPALIKALEDDEQDVRWLAAVALAKIGREAIEPLLNMIVNRSDSQYLRQGMHHILSIYEDPKLHELLMVVRDSLGPAKDYVNVTPAVDKALRDLRQLDNSPPPTE